MDDAGDDFSRVPAEGLVALRAPHLVAAVDFTNARATARTRFCLFPDQVRTFYVLGLTHVFRGGFGQANQVKTLGAGKVIANPALVLGGEKTAAILLTARHNEFPHLFGGYTGHVTAIFQDDDVVL